MKIFIDAGHNYSGFDTGANGNGLREQDVTFYVAKKFGEKLSRTGFEVRYSRENFTDNIGSDVSTSIMQRCDMANSWGADYFISIHCNASTAPSANGTETFIYSKESKAAPLANNINFNLVKLGLTNRGVKIRSDLGVLKYTRMPAALVELAFISNASDAFYLEHRQDDLAQAIYTAILDFTGASNVSNVGQHWAFKYYDWLKLQGIDILEERFDDSATRGEIFKLLALLKGYKE